MDDVQTSAMVPRMVLVAVMAFSGCAAQGDGAVNSLGVDDLEDRVASLLQSDGEVAVQVQCDGALRVGQDQNCAISTRARGQVHLRVAADTSRRGNLNLEMTPFLTPDLLAEAITENVKGQARTQCEDNLLGSVGEQVWCQVRTDTAEARVSATVTSVRDLQIRFKLGR